MLALELSVFLAHLLEVRGYLGEQVHVEAGVEGGAFVDGDDRLGRRLAGPAGEGADCGVKYLCAGFHAFQVSHLGHAACGVAVHMNRNRNRLLERSYQPGGHLRRKQARHVLYAERVAAELLELSGDLDVELGVVHGACGIGERAFGDFAAFLDRFDGELHVAGVVEGVEYAEYVDTDFGGVLYKGDKDIIGIVLVAEDVLPAKEHLEPGVGHMLLYGANPVPGALAQVAHARIESRAAPALDRPVADLVELLEDWRHVLRAHAGRQERLVRVAQDGVGDFELFVFFRRHISPHFHVV